MIERLNNYNFNSNEILCASLTLTGGVLIKRHWAKSCEKQSVCSKWGHRIVAIIESVPILGAIVALIEIIVAKCF